MDFKSRQFSYTFDIVKNIFSILFRLKAPIFFVRWFFQSISEFQNEIRLKNCLHEQILVAIRSEKSFLCMVNIRARQIVNYWKVENVFVHLTLRNFRSDLINLQPSIAETKSGNSTRFIHVKFLKNNKNSFRNQLLWVCFPSQ